MKYVFLAFMVLFCSSCAFEFSYKLEVQNQEVKPKPLCDWKEAFKAAEDDDKQVVLRVEVLFKSMDRVMDVFIEDKGKRYYVSSAATYSVKQARFAFDLKESCKEWKTPFSDEAKIVITPEADLTLISAKVDIGKKKK